ncbi:hypothetical protein GOV09_00075 [Candidatus Woesearchaeota archaeon]|nr:hypothetical protein [Candidatus Woesearchaeota archaeon]
MKLRKLATIGLLYMVSALAPKAEADEGLEIAVNEYIQSTKESASFDTVAWGKKLFVGVGGNTTGLRYAGFMHEREIEGLDVTIGANVADSGETDWEAHGKVGKGPFSFGFGRVDTHGIDTDYVKPEFEFSLPNWNVEIGAILSRFREEDTRYSVGGSIFASNDLFRIGYTNTGEEATYHVGFIAPEGNTLRPVFEVFRYDLDIGDQPGPQITLVNGTLSFTGGFLSHGAGQGRAEGITGANEQNPFFALANANYLAPIENLGSYANFRILDVKPPGGDHQTSCQAVAFPFQIAGMEGFPSGFFLEGSYRDKAGFGVGYKGKNIGVKYEHTGSENKVSVHANFKF